MGPVATERVESGRLVLRASRYVVDAPVAHPAGDELRPHRGTQIDVYLLSPLGPDDARFSCSARDLLTHVAPDLEAACADARADRGDETLALALAGPMVAPSQAVERGRDDAARDAPPAGMDRGDASARFVGDQDGHAVRDAHSHRHGPETLPGNERVAFAAVRAALVADLESVAAVHLPHLRDGPTRLDPERPRELVVRRGALRKGVSEPRPREEGRPQETERVFHRPSINSPPAGEPHGPGRCAKRRHGLDDARKRLVIPLDVAPMRPQDPFIGREILNGTVRILQKIGSGGMGSVYKAMEIESSRMVGIKILHPKLANRKDLVSRFGREARALSQLSHPNTVRVFAYGELEDGALYIIMELLEGKNLNQSVRTEGPFPMGRALPILIQACGALDEAHKAGIIHRDLKPENIFIVHGGALHDFPKLLDFGLAKVGENQMRPGSVILTQEGMVFGTPEFMSPEQAQGKPLAPASDVYSLAVILYEVLTGKLPFDAKSAMDFIQMHVTTKPIPLNQRVPGRTFPPLLEQVMDRALAKRAEDRFASAADFAVAMHAVLQGAAELPPEAFASSPKPLPVSPAAARSPASPRPPASASASGLARTPPPGLVRSPAPAPRGLRAAKANVPLLVGVAVGFLLVGIGLAVALMRLFGSPTP
jgi:serine/threonine protein kinase